MKVKQTTSFIAPSTVRQDNELPFLKQSVYSDGSSGWLSGMQGVLNLTPPVLKQIHGEAFRQMASLALSDRDADRTVNEVSDGVLEISTKDGESVVLTVDEKTGLPAKLAYQQSPAEGGAAVEEIIFGLARRGWPAPAVPMVRHARRQEVRGRYRSGL